MHKDGYWTEVRLKNKLTEAEREFFEVMTRRRQPHRAHPDRLKRSEATFRSVSTADLDLATKGKFYKTDSVFENSYLIVSL